MSKLLEILGKAITPDIANLIWHWLEIVKVIEADADSTQADQLDKIAELAQNKRIVSAEQQLKLYLFTNSSCIRARLAAAAICLQKNQLTYAIEELNSVYLKQPNNTLALYALGHCYERLGKEAQAVEFYQDCLKFKNYLQLPRFRLAAIYFKNRQFEKTILEYELLKDEYPDDMPTLATLGHLYIAAEQYHKAVETFNTAILIHPDNFHADENDVELLIIDGQHHEALEMVENLLAQYPERADLIVKRADILGMLGASTESVEQYEQAIRLCPDFLEATIKLGTQYLQLHQEQMAAEHFNRAAEINDSIIDAYIGLAIAQKIAGNDDVALATLSLAAAIQPNSSLLIAETAILQLRAGLSSDVTNKIENSDKLIDTIIAAHQMQLTEQTQNPDLYYRLGILLMNIDKINEAIDAFQVALEINPTFFRARSKLAICFSETGQKELALNHLTGPNCLDKDTLLLHYQTAILFCNKIKFASSLMNLQKFMEENFAANNTTINISIVLQNLGLLDRATAMWDNLASTANHALNN